MICLQLVPNYKLSDFPPTYLKMSLPFQQTELKNQMFDIATQLTVLLLVPNTNQSKCASVEKFGVTNSDISGFIKSSTGMHKEYD